MSLILRQELASFRLLFHPPTVETPLLVATTHTSPPAGVARAQAPRYIDALTADADADVVLGADDADYSGADDADYSGADDADYSGASGGGGSSSYPNGAKPLHATHINEHISMPDDHNGDADLAVHDVA